MINLHVYPSPFTHESRILRETATLADAACFETIVMVGTAAAGLPRVERIDAHREIRRFERVAGTALAGKVLGTWTWSRAVFQAFAGEPVACVNCHSLPVLPLCARIAARSGATLVYDAHELETETNGLGGLRRIGSKLVERALIRRAAAVIVVGEAIADWYQCEYSIPRPTVLLNCPVRVQPPPGDRADYLRRRLGIAPARKIFLYQGVLGLGRGIEALCEAWHLLGTPRPALVFMGDGPLAQRIDSEQRRNPDVHRLPAVPPGEVIECTGSADVGLCLVEPTCLSYRLCLPNKLFEYLQAGLPVIVSDLPEIRRVVEGDRVGMVVSSAEAAPIAEAVRRMEALGRAPFEGPLAAAAHKYDWNKQAVKLAELYERLGFGVPSLPIARKMADAYARPILAQGRERSDQ